ncbi:MAG: 2-C-methyl-D-erythritol 4-phosphate cytidylyltransferase [Clostridia bacterium]|nr:2-C-methyl-D-erythritol 4-phosphate cytidylyltransferase [Clostridia bacterium]
MKGLFGVLLPAAGSGTRFGRDKLSFPLCGKPVLWHTVSAFQAAESVGCIVIATRKENIEAVKSLTAEFSKVIAVTEGGQTRGESILRAMEALPVEVEYLSIHDAARPLILPEEIDRIHGEAVRYGAVCAGTPVYSTVQRVDSEGFIIDTPDRNSLMAAATPQAFSLALYKESCAKTAGRNFTDDAGLVRAAGGRVKMIRCSEENIKITTPSDGTFAEEILRRRLQK